MDITQFSSIAFIFITFVLLAGGTNIGAMLEAIAQTPSGASLLNAVTSRIDPAA